MSTRVLRPAGAAADVGGVFPDADDNGDARGAGGYFAESRRPLAALAFCLPLVVAYEVGTHLFHLDAGRGVETRIVAFTWVRAAFDGLGATGRLVAPAATVAMLLGWHVFARQPWRLRPATPAAMAAESLLLAVPLLLSAAVLSLAGRPASPLIGLDPALRDGLAGGVLAVGAGVYEELVFRLIGFALLHALLRDGLGLGERPATAWTLAVTSLLFAAYHHVPAAGEPFAWDSFAFRSAAGAWLGMIFLARGFGLAVGSHAAYDGLLVIASALLPLLSPAASASS